jgi:hypothetical protein
MENMMSIRDMVRLALNTRRRLSVLPPIQLCQSFWLGGRSRGSMRSWSSMVHKILVNVYLELIII